MIRIALFLVSLALLLLLVFYNPETAVELYKYLTGLSPLTVFTLLLISLLTLSLRVYRFQLLLGKQFPIPFLELLPIHTYGLSLSDIFPARVSEPIRAVLLKVIKSVPLNMSLALVFLERLSDAFVVLLLAGTVFLSLTDSGFFLPFLAFAAIFLLAVVLSQSKRTLRAVERGMDIVNMGAYKKWVVTLFTDARISRRFALPLILAAVAWSMDGFAYKIALNALGADIDYFTLLGFFSLAALIGLVSFVPGGIGTFEAAMTLLLNRAGVPYSAALGATILTRLLSFWFIVVSGMLFSLTIREDKKRIIRKEIAKVVGKLNLFRRKKKRR